ncbi:serine/threonine-protein kinase MARK2-like isoform X2 [Leptopilina boulardi]|uniref:serine/threonine-protein kinase MARK2-like isoform X2 n=1 Tax=Leptopilina boulardi TaxID=63433 RepID=UPI0021F675F7|nr:serine/threonine-protein kinase MARK2-like isoform X2 [Leptopilina boulardi]
MMQSTLSSSVNKIADNNNKKILNNVGNYHLLRILGKGNFARVAEAFHTVLQSKVAIKIIDTNENRQKYVMKNLTREAKILAMLHHPCIVRLYETIQCGTVYYIVTELATGGDLCTHIKKQPLGRLDEFTAKLYARQLVDALEHMHCRGIVHRDLKMENIMLQDSQHLRIKIVDFGLSNICNNNELLKTHCGSPEYAAPELFIDGKKYGPEVDLWSLGVVFYVMVTGRLPFVSPQDGHTPSEERRRKFMIQINRGLTAFHEKNLSDISSEYKDALNRLLTPIAHKRITIQELGFHPWINDCQKTCWSKVMSEHNLTPNEYSQILNEVADAVHLDKSSVHSSIIQKRYGNIGGMYNIRIHECIQKNSVKIFPKPQTLSNSRAVNKICQIKSINKQVNNNESIKHLFPAQNTRQEFLPLPVNSPKIVSGFVKKERNFEEHQKELFSRGQRKSLVTPTQGNRIIKKQNPIPRLETINRVDSVAQRRSQRLAARQEVLPTRMILRSSTKLSKRDELISESMKVNNNNKISTFYKTIQHPPNSRLSTKAIVALKFVKKDNNQG